MQEHIFGGPIVLFSMQVSFVVSTLVDVYVVQCKHGKKSWSQRRV